MQTSLKQFFKKRDDPQEIVESVENLEENVESMPSNLSVPPPLPSSSDAPSYSGLNVDGWH